MRVNKVEEPAGDLVKIELIHTGNENFKDDLKAWIRTYYPTWNYEEFFNRLLLFQAGTCIIDVRE